MHSSTSAGVVTGAWQRSEAVLTAAGEYANPYTDVQVWADYTHESGTVLRRPAFFDGGGTWRLRFASPLPAGRWTWRSASTPADPGLDGRVGELLVEPADGVPESVFQRHGFWRMSPEGRHLVHADGRPALLVADTAWALPWRATVEQARVFAADRSAKGFNAALLMSVQPDMDAVGPEDRDADEGFAVAFRDLPAGRLEELVPEYFQYLDALLDVLLEHDIVPVLQPVFHGFGWKGQRSAGPVVSELDYARYCRYLVARYGASPAVYLVGADGPGDLPSIGAGGAEVHAWDAYAQPTGIHYSPRASNRAYQDADWLDFQWCQTGHGGEHVPERLADMARNVPEKAIANGEPTYEHTGRTGHAAGWWQGHEAWVNLCAGATMGVVYGAGSLWQWKLRPDEPGQSDFFAAPGAGWREALEFEGSRYVGLVGRILDGVPLTGARPDWSHAGHPRGLFVPGELFLTYLSDGGDLLIRADGLPRRYRVIDPRSGEVVAAGERESELAPVPDPGGAPRVYLLTAP